MIKVAGWIVVWIAGMPIGILAMLWGDCLTDDRALWGSVRMFGGFLIFLGASIILTMLVSFHENRQVVFRSLYRLYHTPIASDYERSERFERLFARPAPYQRLIPVVHALKHERNRREMLADLGCQVS